MLSRLLRLSRAAAASSEAEAALSTAIELGQDNEPPAEFRIFRAGANSSDKGTFVFDAEAARSVMAAFAKKGTALTMDYEHMAAADPPVIAPASASSWVPEVRNGELWATQVNWTEKARAHIKAREYTRFSPLFFHDKKSGRVLRVVNCALTNVEALDNVQPLVAANATRGETHMKTMSCKGCKTALRTPTETDEGDEVICTACGGFPKALRAVGLRVDMNEHDALSELSALGGFKATVLSLTGKGTIAEALGVISGWKSNDQEIARLRADNERIETERLTGEFNGILDAAVKDGKLTPASRESLVALATKRDAGKVTKDAIELVKADIATRTKQVATTETEQKKTAAGLISAEDREVARMLGHKVEDVQKFKETQLTTG